MPTVKSTAWNASEDLNMAVHEIKQEERGNLSPQMALLHMRWQQIRQIELHQVLQPSRTVRAIHANKVKQQFSAA